MRDINTIAILCGGKSGRLGVNKALLKVDSSFLVEYVINRVKRYFKNIFLVTKSLADADMLKTLLRDVIVVRDSVTDKQGPIFGLLTAAEKTVEDVFFVLSCDTPLVDLNVVDILHKSIGDHNAVVPRWPNGFIEPLYAVYRRDALMKGIKQALSDGKYELAYLVSKIPRVLYFSTLMIQKFDSELDCFLNINTPRDFEKFIRKIKAGVK